MTLAKGAQGARLAVPAWPAQTGFFFRKGEMLPAASLGLRAFFCSPPQGVLETRSRLLDWLICCLQSLQLQQSPRAAEYGVWQLCQCLFWHCRWKARAPSFSPSNSSLQRKVPGGSLKASLPASFQPLRPPSSSWWGMKR